MNLKFKLMLLATLIFNAALIAQNGITVNGVVVSATDNVPIPGVNVIVLNTTNGTTTDFDGNYQIAVSQGDQLQFSYVKTKILKDLNASDTDILRTDSWGDDAGFTFSEEVGFDKFTLEVKVSDGRMEVILNDKESVVYNDIHIEKWGAFENYFKAGNYLVTKDLGAYTRIKYYKLDISH